MVQAAEWYRKAADQGDVGAQGTMGTLYSMGQGVQQSYAEAYYWLDLAAAVKGPKQGQYAANRQMIGMHLLPMNWQMFKIAKQSGKPHIRAERSSGWRLRQFLSYRVLS